MPKKIKECSKAHLISVPLPDHGDSYTVISHESVINHVYYELAAAGFGIVSEEYRATADGNIAQGIHVLQYNFDPELSMMFAWTNSYNKQVRFKCGIGAYVNQIGTSMVCGDMGSWTRKHTGSADEETVATIKEQIANAHMYYAQLVADKNAMKDIQMNKRKQAQLLGILFAEYQILTTEQANIVRSQMNKPTHVFEDFSSLWAFYNYVTTALQTSHPKTWMEDQRVLHYFISSVNNFSKPLPVEVEIEHEEEERVADPLLNNYGEPENQTNILIQIAEETGDDTLLKAQYPVTPDDAFQTEAAPEPTEEEVAAANKAWGITENTDHVIVENEIWTTEDEPKKIATILDEVMHYDLVQIAEAEEASLELEPTMSNLDLSTFNLENNLNDSNVEEVPNEVIEETLIYTDPVGNTFEAPVIDVVELNRETQMSVIVVESEDTEDDFAFDFSDDEDDDSSEFF
jgi:hypothetical protein